MLTSHCHSERVRVKKKKKPPVLHGRCCHDNRLDQFSHFLIPGVPPAASLSLSLSFPPSLALRLELNSHRQAAGNRKSAGGAAFLLWR